MGEEADALKGASDSGRCELVGLQRTLAHSRESNGPTRRGHESAGDVERCRLSSTIETKNHNA